MKEGARKIPDSDIFSLRKVAVDGSDVATDDEYGADECETDVWERAGGVNKREVDEEREGRYANGGVDGDSFGRE